jgi:hypothetical protein
MSLLTIKGAIQSFVFSAGQDLAHFQFLIVRRPSAAKHRNLSGEFETTGLL